MKYIPYGLHWIDEDDIKSVVEVLSGDWITSGPRVEGFERAVSERVGSRFATAVSSGTAALEVAVQSLELPKGSEVITTPFTFLATANSIVYNGLSPVFADIQGDTRNIDPEDVRRRVTDKTGAIIYVDYAGQPCDIDELREVADDHGLRLVDDGSHALGAEYKGQKVGAIADVTTFSFHPVKHVTSGEGGMVTTDDPGLDERLKMLRNHGIDRDAKARYGSDAPYAYDMKYLGRNYRINDIQCALGISQMRRLDEFIGRRVEIAERYSGLLSDAMSVELPATRGDRTHVWHIYTILLARGIDRDGFFRHMRGVGIGVNVLYIPVYRHSYYVENFGFDAGDYPVTEDVFSRIITLPLFPKMTDEDIERCVDAVRAYGG